MINKENEKNRPTKMQKPHNKNQSKSADVNKTAY